MFHATNVETVEWEAEAEAEERQEEGKERKEEAKEGAIVILKGL